MTTATATGPQNRVYSKAEKLAENRDHPEIKLKAASACATICGTHLKALEQHVIANELEIAMRYGGG